MTKKIIYISLLISLITSCSTENVIFYEYNGVTITRVENGNINYFYYGRFDKGEYPDNYIKSEYSGLNSGMYAYMIFQPDKSVEIRSSMGIFRDEKAPDSLRMFSDEIKEFEFSNWRDSVDNINGSYENVIEVNSVLKQEQERNKKHQSKVNAVYP